MRTRLYVLSPLCIVASLFILVTVSANTPVIAEAHDGHVVLADPLLTRGAASQTLDLHQGYELADYDCASGSLLAARGGWRIGSKITKQMEKRGGTKEAIDEAVKSGEQIRVVNEESDDAACNLDGQNPSPWGHTSLSRRSKGPDYRPSAIKRSTSVLSTPRISS